MPTFTDSSSPIIPTDLSGFDNYQIYDLICTSVTTITQVTNYTEGKVVDHYFPQSISTVNLPANSTPGSPIDNTYKDTPTWTARNAGSYGVYGHPSFLQIWGFYSDYQKQNIQDYNGFLTLLPATTATSYGRVYALQRWMPGGKQVDKETIETILTELPYKPPLITVGCRTTKPAPTPQATSSGQAINWENLVINQVLEYSGIAAVNKVLTIKYWGINPLESHPSINKTIDYWEQKVILKKGKLYKFKLYHPVAHTLRVPAEILSTATPKLPNSFLLQNLLFTNRNYLASLSPVPPTGAIAFPTYDDYKQVGWKKYHISEFFVINYPATYGSDGYYWADVDPDLNIWIDRKTEVTQTFQGYKVLRANNKVVASTFGTTAAPGDYPQLQASDIENWHYKLQANGSYGDLVMDSPKTIRNNEILEELAIAFESEKYSTNNTTPGSPMVKTLAWLIEAGNRVLGNRFDDDGKIDLASEKSNYLPATLNNPSNPDGNYGLTSFGARGRFMPYLPTTYKNGKEEILHDVVHDIPQMLEAFLRQLDISLGIQHGSEIRTRSIDGTMQEFPNQLALLQHISNLSEKAAYNSGKLINITTVTSSEVRGLYGGIGIPVIQSWLTIKDGKNDVKLPFFTYQKNMPSILDHITSLQANIAIINGTIAPQKRPNNKLDPFKVFTGAE